MYRNILFQIRTANLVEIDGVGKAIYIKRKMQRVRISYTFVDRYKNQQKIQVSDEHLYSIT